MRILVTSIVDPLMTAHNRLHHFISALAEDNKITVIAVKETWKPETANVTTYAETGMSFMKGIDIQYLGSSRKPAWQEFSSVWKLKSILNGIGSEDYDVHLDYNSLFMGNSLNARTNIPITVYDLADDLIEMVKTSPQIHSVLSPTVARIAQRLVMRMTQEANLVTCISRRLLDKYRVTVDKGAVVPNGVDTRLFAPANGIEVREKLGIPLDVFVVGYVGVLREWVDMCMILRAIHKLNQAGDNVRLLIVGEEGGLNRVKAYADTLGLRERITAVGTVAYKDVPGMISAMDTGIIPFRPGAIAEGAVPLKLFEYMSCGKPVVTTYSESIYEHAGHNVLYADNEQQVRSQISRLIRNREEYESFASKGRGLVLGRHSWEAIEARIRTLIETCQPNCVRPGTEN